MGIVGVAFLLLVAGLEIISSQQLNDPAWPCEVAAPNQPFSMEATVDGDVEFTTDDGAHIIDSRCRQSRLDARRALQNAIAPLAHVATTTGQQDQNFTSVITVFTVPQPTKLATNTSDMTFFVLLSPYNRDFQYWDLGFLISTSYNKAANRRDWVIRTTYRTLNPAGPSPAASSVSMPLTPGDNIQLTMKYLGPGNNKANTYRWTIRAASIASPNAKMEMTLDSNWQAAAIHIGLFNPVFGGSPCRLSMPPPFLFTKIETKIDGKSWVTPWRPSNAMPNAECKEQAMPFTKNSVQILWNK